MNGFIGKLLKVDLTRGKVISEDLDEKDARLFGGGVGYAAKILWDELRPRTDPLSPENLLIFATGPLTGTLATNSGSWEACFKSPLTNVWAESRSGGSWGPKLKHGGYDFLIVTGKAKRPVYIWINNKEVEIKSAKEVFRKNVPETNKLIKEEIGDPKASVAAIGQAGENLVKFACIMNDVDRAAGRCGGGAVMGSKNLKAVAVNGLTDITVADSDGFMKAVEEAEEEMVGSEGWNDTMKGTISLLPIVNEHGDLPTKHALTTSWENADSTYDAYVERNFIKKRACWGCSVACGRHSRVFNDHWGTPHHGGPEYETAAVFSSFLLQDDVDVIVRANYLCNLYGLDTISCGGTIGYAMMLYDKNIIDKKITGGVELNWGNSASILQLIDMISRREGIGDILAEGVRSVSKKFGSKAEKTALHVKGLEMPMHDPRAGKSLALQYGTANRGMCHIHPIESHNVETSDMDWGLTPREAYGLPKVNDRFSEDKDKAIIAKVGQDYGILHDIMGVCKFPIYCGCTLKMYAKMYSTATGWKISDIDMLTLGERVFNLQRCFNVREGIQRRDDLIPYGLTRPATSGSAKGVAVTNYEAMLDYYYELRGWDKHGVPMRRKLKELDLAAYLPSSS